MSKATVEEVRTERVRETIDRRTKTGLRTRVVTTLSYRVAIDGVQRPEVYFARAQAESFAKGWNAAMSSKA